MEKSTPRIRLRDFLTDAQIKRVFELKKARPICDEVITPNLEAINDKLGQENHALYIAYACEFLVNEETKNR